MKQMEPSYGGREKEGQFQQSGQMLFSREDERRSPDWTTLIANLRADIRRGSVEDSSKRTKALDVLATAGNLPKKIRAELDELNPKPDGSVTVSAKRMKRLHSALDELTNTVGVLSGTLKEGSEKCTPLIIPTEENNTAKIKFRRLSEGERCHAACKMRSVSLGAHAAVVASRLRFATCGVVSSSGLMREHEFGKDIDSNDAVMRFNKAPIVSAANSRTLTTVGFDDSNDEAEKYAKIAGTKETVRMINARGLDAGVAGLRLGKFSNSFMLVVDGEESLGSSVIGLSGVNEGLKEVLKSFFPTVANSTFGRSKNTLTSGFVGIFFMLHLCDKVTLYEMVPSLLDSSAGWHYWERGGFASSNPWHNSIPYETAFWRALALADTASAGRIELNGFRLQEELCEAGTQRAATLTSVERNRLWTHWGYTTKGDQVNPKAGMWVPPPEA